MLVTTRPAAGSILKPVLEISGHKDEQEGQAETDVRPRAVDFITASSDLMAACARDHV